MVGDGRLLEIVRKAVSILRLVRIRSRRQADQGEEVLGLVEIEWLAPAESRTS